ncbi:hypothetical protein HHI36_018741 [Cryptolaemus montrouzieri]|uniref:Nuclear RNA export factor 2 n=1 Tax=Cryptolaemus montrouzieri TaxID=559131 RepID=A0ABD2P0X8_9CUCU
MINIQELVRKHKESVILDTESIRTGVLFRNASILKNSNSWHAFILHNVEPQERNEVLKIVLDHLYPLELIPVKFERRGNDCMFMARNCTEAIEKLCKDNLFIPNPSDPMSPIRCEIVLQYSTMYQIRVDIQKNISSVLHSLFDSSTKILNLDNFSANPELSEYCPLSQPKIMYFVLHIALGMHPIGIKLTNNEIQSLFPMEALWSCTSLTNIDLRNNKIDNIQLLDTLKMTNLVELWLDGNPLCDKLDEYSYITQVKQILPKIERLDGITIAKNGVPAFKTNYLCDSAGFNIVDQFIDYFFPLYDSERKLLENLYNPNAMCSMTNLYKNGQTSSHAARLRSYQINSRNLLAMADLSRSQQYLIKGNQCIIRKLKALPRTEHDPFSFTVDLMHYSDNCAVISITGVFREIPETLLEAERHLGFCRTFVLTGSKGEFTIANDMLHVYNALTCQSVKAFSISKPIKNKSIPIPTTFRDKEKAVHAIQMVTGATKEWSRRFLEDSNFDVTRCIKTFMEHFKIDKIPAEAFKHQV